MPSPDPKSLRFKHLRLANWRNFERVDVALQARVFLVGPNASGKSNLLDCFRFLNNLVSLGGGFQEAVTARGGVSKLRCLAARRYPDIEMTVTIGVPSEDQDWIYDLAIAQDNRRQPYIRREVVKRGDKTILSRPGHDDEVDPARLRQTHLEQINVNRDFRELADFFRSVQYFHLVPQLFRDPERYAGKPRDPFGSDFLEQIARTPAKTRTAWLHRIGEALRVAVPQLKALEFYREEATGTPHLRGNYEHWRPQGAWQTEEHFSDGTLRLLGLLWAVLDGSGPLLLEEPELSLHPDVVRFLPQMFARMQRRTGRQVILSSHSSDILRDEGIGLDEVLLLLPGREGTTVEVATKIKQAEVLLRGGVPLSDIVLPETRPPKPEQLSFFGR